MKLVCNFTTCVDLGRRQTGPSIWLERNKWIRRLTAFSRGRLSVTPLFPSINYPPKTASQGRTIICPAPSSRGSMALLFLEFGSLVAVSTKCCHHQKHFWEQRLGLPGVISAVGCSWEGVFSQTLRDELLCNPGILSQLGLRRRCQLSVACGAVRCGAVLCCASLQADAVLRGVTEGSLRSSDSKFWYWHRGRGVWMSHHL